MRHGDRGPAVSDLQQRLRRVGFDPGADGVYDDATRDAVVAFQEKRRIRADGICGRQTWMAVVEAGWRLGDRLLFERRPMQRGDDVADVQRRLGGLGFLEDRVDGILGPRTRGAVEDFQRNSGLTVDGICGPETVAERVAWMDASFAAVADLRAEGLDVVAYTWWPLFDMYEWTWRTSDGPRADHLLTMGLYALEERADGLARVPTPLVGRFLHHARRARRAAHRDVGAAPAEGQA